MAEPITSAEELRDTLIPVIRRSIKLPGWTVRSSEGDGHKIVVEHKSGEAYSLTVRPCGSNSPNNRS